jgi:hypothetical protein
MELLVPGRRVTLGRVLPREEAVRLLEAARRT